MTHILVIEDSLDVTEMLVELLSDVGYGVTCARDGESGLRALTSEISLVILDIGLPGMQGWDVLSLFRRVSLVPILILSAQDEWEKKVKGLKSGADDYIPKPFQPEELLARIEALLRRTSGTPEQPIVESNPALRTYLFGPFEVFLGREKFTDQTWKRKKVRNLLAYLVVNWRRPVAEDCLLQDFWPGTHERGKRSLYQATWELRRALRLTDQPEFDYIKRSGGFFSLNRDLPRWSDFELFENSYLQARKLQDSGRHREAASLHTQVVQLVRGPFLQDCYQDWANVIRNSVTQRAMNSHSYLMNSAKDAGNSLLCQEHAESLLDLDAYNQAAHLSLMEAWLDLGHPARAVDHFEGCQKLLKEELGVDPSDELLEIYQRALLS